MAFNGQQGLQVPELGTDDEPNYAQYGLAQYRSTPYGYGFDYTQQTVNGQAGRYQRYRPPNDGNVDSTHNMSNFNNGPPLAWDSHLQMYAPVIANVQAADGHININEIQLQSMSGTQGLETGNAASSSTYIPQSANTHAAELAVYYGSPSNLNSPRPYHLSGSLDLWAAGRDDTFDEQSYNYNSFVPFDQLAGNEGLESSQHINEPTATAASHLSPNTLTPHEEESEEADVHAGVPLHDDQGLQGQALTDGESKEGEPEDEPIEDFRQDRAKNKTGTTNEKVPKCEKPGTKQLGVKIGSVRNTNGLLEWWDAAAKAWKAAVIHHDIRPQLQRLALALHPGASYAHPDPNAGDPFNDTSFFPRHQNWGPARADRPDIVWRWEKGDESELPADRGGPGWMMFEGKVVLDPHDNPIKDYWNIPAVLSPWTEGYKLEAMSRENSRIEHTDFWARMPREYNETIKGQRVRTSLSRPNARINMPIGRFRLKAGCQSWVSRDGTQNIRAGLLALFTEHNFDPVASGNSTEGFGRDLEPWEREKVKLGNVGQFGARAGGRALNEATRIRNIEEKKKRIEWKTSSFAIQDPGTSQSTAGSGRQKSRQDSNGGILPTYNPYAGSSKSDAIAAESADEGEGDSPGDSLFEDDTLIPHLPSSEKSLPNENCSATFDSSSSVKVPSLSQASAIQGKRKRDTLAETVNDDNEGGLPTSKRRHMPRNARLSTTVLKRDLQRVPSKRPAEEIDLAFAPFALQPSKDQSQTEKAGSPEKRKRDALEAGNEDDGIENDMPSPKRRENSHGEHLGEASTTRNPKITVPSRTNLARQRHPKPRHTSSAYVRTVGIDYREVAPRNEAERRSLDEALMSSRAAYFEWTGHPAPLTDRSASYMAQYNHLCASLTFDWGMQSRDPVPHLVVLPAWGTSISSWSPHIKDDEYFEAWRYGYRAPRTADGKPIEVPGHLLERLAKEGDRRALMLEGLMLGFGYVPNGQCWEVEF